MTAEELAMLREHAAYCRRQQRALAGLGKHPEAGRWAREADSVEARIAAAEANRVMDKSAA